MKKEIKLRLEAQERVAKAEKEDKDLDITEDELNSLFDVSEYEGLESGLKEFNDKKDEIVPQETTGPKASDKSSKKSSPAPTVHLKDKPKIKDAVDLFDDEIDWGVEDDEVDLSVEPEIIEADVDEKEFQEKVAKKMAEATMEEPEEDTEEETELEVIKEPEEVPTTRPSYPKVDPASVEIGFVVKKGQFFGKVGQGTFVTIKKGKFEPIAWKKFSEMRKNRVIRVTDVKIPNAPPSLDPELLFRFIIKMVKYSIARIGESFALKIWDYDPSAPAFEHGHGFILDSNRFMALSSPESQAHWLPEKLPIKSFEYPKDVLGLTYRINGDLYDKENYQKLEDVLSGRSYTRYTNKGGLLVFLDNPTQNILVLANSNPKPESEIDEIDSDEEE